MEALQDKKDKIRSKLFSKKILELCCVDVDPSRGHWSSGANIYQCLQCGKLITDDVATVVPCEPENAGINRKGKIEYRHAM